MDKEGVIEYSEPKNLGHKVISKINRKHSLLTEFAPKFKLKRVKQTKK